MPVLTINTDLEKKGGGGAAGLNDIPMQAVKVDNGFTPRPPFHIVELSFKEGQYPCSLKEIVISPIHEGKSKHDVINF